MWSRRCFCACAVASSALACGGKTERSFGEGLLAGCITHRNNARQLPLAGIARARGVRAITFSAGRRDRAVGATPAERRRETEWFVALCRGLQAHIHTYLVDCGLFAVQVCFDTSHCLLYRGHLQWEPKHNATQKQTIVRWRRTISNAQR